MVAVRFGTPFTGFYRFQHDEAGSEVIDQRTGDSHVANELDSYGLVV